jgi:hypothetical protein
MATTQDYHDLSDAFHEAVDAFNHADAASLNNLLDAGVSYTQIHDQNTAVNGRAAAVPALVNRANAVAPDVPLSLTGPISINAESGIVDGTAIWVRPNPPAGSLPRTQMVTFRFLFTRNAAGGWVLKHMSGAPHSQ